MKKRYRIIIIIVCCLTWLAAVVLVGTRTAGAGDSKIITNHLPWIETLPNNWHIESLECRWEYMSIRDGKKVPEGWEPFGVTTTFDYDQKAIGEYRLHCNRHYIWLKHRVCQD